MRKFMPWILIIAACVALVWLLVSHSASETTLNLDTVNLVSSNNPVGQVLDGMEDEVQIIINQASAALSMVATKGARDVELLIQNARQEMHSELDVRENHLESHEKLILGTIKQSMAQLHAEIGQAGQLKDEVVLDIDDTLNRLPFTKTTPKIQRVS